MKKLILFALVVTFVFSTILVSQTVRPPLGTPENPEIRNDPAKPLQIVSASCKRAFDPKPPRCVAEVKFADSGGPWAGFVLVWTLRYEDGKIIQSTWSKEGRLPNGLTPDPNHFKNGSVITMGTNHNDGVKTKDGRQLAIVNAAVEVRSVTAESTSP